MASLFEAMGYTNERAHTGMICYMLQLFNEGNKKPFESFMQKLHPNFEKPAGYIAAIPEYRKIDLVITNQDHKPIAAFEMKVDSHEHQCKIRGKNEWKAQTEVYAGRLEDENDDDQTPGKRFFVTLGVGEFYADPKGGGFRHRGLSVFTAAVQAAVECSTGIEKILLKDWLEMLKNEIRIRDLIADRRYDDVPRKDELRKGLWNACVLGSIRDALLKRDEIPEGPTINLREGYDPRFYLHGSAPDTILNIWWMPVRDSDNVEYLYTEVNNNGKLNLKVQFSSNCGTKREREPVLEKGRRAIDRVLCELPDGILDVCPQSRNGKTQTLATIDIGLQKASEGLRLAGGRTAETAADRIIQVINRLEDDRDIML